MASLTNGNSTSKINRIQGDEKELLFQLREIYASDYRKYSEHIRRESNIPLSIKKIYKLLDERKAYRRISDFFHRIRRTTKARSSLPNNHHKSHYRSSTRRISSEPESMSAMQIVNEMDDDNDNHQHSDSSTMLNDSDEVIENNHKTPDYTAQLQPSSSISANHQQPLITSTSSKPNLLAVRSSIQKALRELDRAIISKSDGMVEEYDNERQQSLTSKISFLSNGHSNLDDIVRSLSSVVSQQQDNARLIINESSALLDEDSNRSERLTTQQSIKHVIDRLNTLVERGHSIYDRVESILSEF